MEPAMSDVIQSLHRQLAELEEDLRLIQERKAEYVLETDVPLQLIKNERRLETQIADLRARVDRLAQRSLDANDLEVLQVQLAILETAQQNTPDPRRFQPRIDELQAAIAGWDERIEKQRQRIADGLEGQRWQMAEENVRRRDQERLRVVGRRPLDVTDYFKDREREQVTIGQLLAEPATRLVSITGHGGIGKTALACKVLQDLERHRWPHTDEDIPLDGIVYLSTRTVGISLERLFLDCAKVVGGEQKVRLNGIWTNPQIGTEEKVSYLLEALSDGRYVTLLDNIEDLLDDQGQLLDEDLRLFFEHSLTTSHGARLLVTSRIALAFRREVMRFDRQVKLLEGLPIADGVALLRELDPNGDYGLQDGPEEELAQAVSLAHGVPRALEVLAGILANDPFSSLADVMEQFYEREDVVQALIEENYKRLDGDARRVIEALAVFRRPVPPLAVDYLLKPFAPGLDVPSVVRRLTRTNIASVDRATRTVTLHPIDQDYAYSQLPGDEGEHAYTRQALERRAADYYASIRKPESEWESIDDLEPQLAEFEHRVRGGDYDEACRVLRPIDFGYLYRWGHYARLVEMRERLLGRITDPGLQAGNLGSLGNACHAVGHVRQAIGFHEQALAVAREIGNRQMESNQLGSLGFDYRTLGQVEQSIGFHEQSLTIAREIGNRQAESVQLGNLGNAHRFLGRVELAIKFYKEALTIAREIDRRQPESSWLGNLGNAYCSLGQFERAIEFYEQALSIVCEIGYRQGEMFWRNGLGNVYCVLGQVEQAIELHEEALAIARRIGARLGEIHCLLGLGKALLATGRLSEARRHCAEAETSYSAVLTLGIVLLRQGDPAAGDAFVDTVTHCRAMLDKTAGLYETRYVLAAALVGQAVCHPRWAEQSERAELLAPALAEYQRALENCAAPGVVQEALWNLEMIRAAGIEGLEPAFELLESAGEVHNV